jgi:methionyl-tRNA formyltransferase
VRIVFIGTGDIGLPTFRWLLTVPTFEVVAVITQPDRPVGRRQELTPPKVKTEALAYGVPVMQPLRLRDPNNIAEIAALKPDVIVVMAYGQILPKELLEIPRLACLNLHASLLPRWRGASPIQAAIAAGDEKTGVTVMYMAEGLDTGDILLMKEMIIASRETGGSLHDRLAEDAPGALAVALAVLDRGQAPRVPQPAEGVTYAGKLTREHGELDFSLGRLAVERLIRAYNPWPGAATTLPNGDGGKRLKLHDSQALESPVLAPGIAQESPEGLLIGTGDGCVLVTDLQTEGKKRMSGVEWLRGQKIEPGTRLGK